MKKKTLIVVLIIALLFSNLNIAVSSAKAAPQLNKTKATITIGNSVTLKMKNTNLAPKWSSSKKSIASVNKYGKVTAKKAGTAKITATVGKHEYICKVVIPKQYISEKKIKLKVDGMKRLKMHGVSKQDTVLWGIGQDDIAVVLDDGTVIAIKPGSTQVFATVNDERIYSCDVEVEEDTSDSSLPSIPTITPVPQPTPDYNNTVAEYGSVSGNITYYYNNFKGNVSDTGAQVILIPLDDDRIAKNMPDLNSYIIWQLPTSLNKVGNPYKVYSGQVDGFGSYTLQNIITGQYIVFVISKKTTSGSAFDDKENYKNTIKELVLPCLSTTNAEYLGETVGYNKYFWGIITVNKNQTTIFSHDFGITYI